MTTLWRHNDAVLKKIKITKMLKYQIMKTYGLTIALTNTVTSQVKSFEVNNA